MRARCGRCKAEVEGSYRHPKLRRVAKFYGLVWIPIVPILPIMASDYVVSLPILMVYMLGFGPVYAIISQRPECDDCGAYVHPV
jgi:hypothetical protein